MIGAVSNIYFLFRRNEVYMVLSCAIEQIYVDFTSPFTLLVMKDGLLHYS